MNKGPGVGRWLVGIAVTLCAIAALGLLKSPSGPAAGYLLVWMLIPLAVVVIMRMKKRRTDSSADPGMPIVEPPERCALSVRADPPEAGKSETPPPMAGPQTNCMDYIGSPTPCDSCVTMTTPPYLAEPRSNCSSCGAPVTPGKEDRCEYCGTRLAQ